jgi:hypothetical protein
MRMLFYSELILFQVLVVVVVASVVAGVYRVITHK